MGLQTLGGLGLYDGGSLQQQGGDRSGFILASYGAMYSNSNANAHGGYGVPVEENTLELRKAMLHTRHFFSVPCLYNQPQHSACDARRQLTIKRTCITCMGVILSCMCRKYLLPCKVDISV